MTGHLVSDSVYGRVAFDDPMWTTNQIYSQSFIHAISACSAFVAFIWSVFVINQQKEKILFDESFGDNSYELKDYNSYHKQKQQVGNQIKQLFHFNNIKQTFVTVFRKRPNTTRAQIWLTICGTTCYLYVFISVPSFVDEFYEQIYGWYTTDFAEYQASGTVVKCLFVLTATIILTKLYHFEDMALTVFGFSSLTLKLIILATIVNPVGYYISVAVSGVEWMANVGLRAQLSNLVSPTELGKIFTLLTIIDVVVPPVVNILPNSVGDTRFDNWALNPTFAIHSTPLTATDM
ncbi:unnamed protein product [Oppiella nova]|uniref:Uncharacterized protein n=1 Tax=Oppiella nova TaxID=334625 RepID=A0A7R9MDV8_9ACAR|nr:unnamed protein product [Oppiella nova]CAG2174359.1 unnamed protein product [Oppiella nova]